VDAELILYGQVHGIAGTDHRRRDLMVALLYGTPIALAFGLLAALGSTLSTMLIAATGVWYSKWVDAVIQRVTEVNLILPVLPILIMVGTFYSRSIWLMLGVVVLIEYLWRWHQNLPGHLLASERNTVHRSCSGLWYG
jgi:peptide/nickel transport system permease protein